MSDTQTPEPKHRKSASPYKNQKLSLDALLQTEESQSESASPVLKQQTQQIEPVKRVKKISVPAEETQKSQKIEEKTPIKEVNEIPVKEPVIKETAETSVEEAIPKDIISETASAEEIPVKASADESEPDITVVSLEDLLPEEPKTEVSPETPSSEEATVTEKAPVKKVVKKTSAAKAASSKTGSSKTTSKTTGTKSTTSKSGTKKSSGSSTTKTASKGTTTKTTKAKRSARPSSIQKQLPPKPSPVRIAVLSVLFLISFLLFILSIQFLANSIHGKKPDQLPANTEGSAASDETDSSSSENSADAFADGAVSLTVTLCGDCTFGMDDEYFAYSSSFNEYYNDYGSSYFFRNVKSIFEEDDLTIANLECSFTEATNRDPGHLYCFKAPDYYAEMLPDASIEAVNLANNHTRDFLDEGYNDTRAALDAVSMPHFGYEETAVLDVKGVKVGLIGTYELIEGKGIETQLQANIEKVRSEGAEIVIVIFHWGEELDIEPRENQLYLAHKAIDFGADLVCGGHAHVLQGIEEYKGKNILYGIGNFCFGGNVYPHDMDTIIYQQTFTVDENGLKDDLVTNIIPCSVSSEEGYNNYQPTVATGGDADRILSKLEERSKNLPEYTY